MVINSNGGTRLISCSLFLDGKYITSYSADGLIIATPTGSTAYNLSAGGPIITPWLSLFTITPICPHSLSSRPIVLPGDSNLKIAFPSNETLHLSADGQVNYEIQPDSEIFINAKVNNKVFTNFDVDNDKNYLQNLFLFQLSYQP